MGLGRTDEMVVDDETVEVGVAGSGDIRAVVERGAGDGVRGRRPLREKLCTKDCSTDFCDPSVPLRGRVVVEFVAVCGGARGTVDRCSLMGLGGGLGYPSKIEASPSDNNSSESRGGAVVGGEDQMRPSWLLLLLVESVGGNPRGLDRRRTL